MTVSANAIEARYGLTPMQQGMLFHALYDTASEAYFIQIRARLDGPLNREAFEAAWQRLGQRHPVLRTAFAWQRQDAAQQVVWQRARIPVDLIEPAEGVPTEAWLDDLAAKDRARGFDLSRAPLMRLTLVRLAANRHALMWSLHHLLVDGWSLSSLLDELLSDYAALCEGREVRFAPRPAFEQYVRWVQRQTEGRAQAFWTTQLGSLDEATALAAGRTAGVLPHHEEQVALLDTAATRALIQKAEHQAVTLSNLMLAMWMLCLSRWVAQHDVCCGVTVSGRPEELPGAPDMVGLLINTLPLRLKVDESESLQGWLHRVQVTMAALQRHAHVGLVDIQRWSGLGSGSSLFDHLFVFENYPLAQRSEAVAGLRIEEVQSTEPTDYPLTVVIVPGEQLRIQFSLDANRLPSARAQSLLGQYREVLLQTCAADPESPLHALSLLDLKGRTHMLRGLNDTGHNEPLVLVHEAFAASAALHPQATAAVVEQREVSYAELAARSLRLSNQLSRLGVRSDQPVAVLLPRGLDMLVAVLALSHSGGVCVPLDPDYPDARLSSILDDAQPALLLTVRDMVLARGHLWAERDAVQVLDMKSDSALQSEPAPQALAPLAPLHPDHLFYIVYTSGSTGRPKGIGLPHRAMANLVSWHVRTLPPAPRMLQFASLGFDASFHEIFAAWASGGCVVMIDDAQRRDFSALLHRVHDQRVDRVVLPVVVLQRWAMDHGDEPVLFEHLRQVITTGEQLQITHAVQSLFDRLPHCELHNHYGPAETHVVTAHRLSGAPCRWPVYPPVGPPLQNTTAFVLDDWLRPTPTGVAGELYLGGAHLARGYWGRPDLTAEKFVPHPWPVIPGERLYRTGDQARWNEAGEIEFLGRRDLMVKIRGFRVELGEIEAVIGEHPAVASCAVQLREDRPGDRVLVAYCIGRVEGPLPVKALRSHVATRLPDYMVPSAWVALEALPLNTNGKIHRRALPAPQEERRRTGGRLSVPATALEELLASIWSEVLGCGQVLREDDFFALGGHSLRAVQVMARVRGALKVQLALRVLFEHPRLEAFAQAVLAAQASSPARIPAEAPAPVRREPKACFPLSHAQERFYILDQLSPGSAINQVAGVLELHGSLNEHALHAAWHALLHRHEPLRTRIVLQADRPLQTLSDEYPTLETAAPSEPQVAEAFIRSFCSQPIPILGAPLLRAVLINREPRRHSLVLSLHHAVIDGESISVLLQDLAALYAAAIDAGLDAKAGSSGASSSSSTTLESLAGLPPLALQLIDLAVHERDQLPPPWASDVSFWAEHLRDLPVLALPLDRPRPPHQSHRGSTLSLELDPHLLERAGVLARRLGMTEAMLHLGVLTHWLCRLCDQDEVAIGMPVSLRHRQPQEGLVGLFLNTVVLRLQSGLDTPLGAWLHSVRHELLQAHAHAAAPFDRVVRAVDPPRDRGRSPLFQVLFDHHGWSEDSLQAGGLSWTPAPVADDRAKFDLTLTVEATRSGRTELLLEFDTALIDASTAQGWLHAHKAVLNSLVDSMLDAGAQSKLTGRSLSLIDQQSRNTLSGWQLGPTSPAAPNSIVPALLRLPTDKSQRPALVDRHGSLSRADFTALVLQQANTLRRHGVGPETLVALNLPRSRELVVALCAVLVAGGAYLPLDPDHPQARRATLLQRSGARLVLGLGAAETALAAVCPWLDVETPAAKGSITGLAASDHGNPDPQQLAYVLFTSGSTGEPKGVQIEHAALASYLDFAQRDYAPGAKPLDMALFTAATFDLTVTTFYLPLLTGGTLHIIDPGLTPPAQLAHAMRVSEAIKLTPSHLSMLALQRMPAPQLQVAIVGGEALTPEQILALCTCAPQVRVVNEYGPTEATVGCVIATVNGREPRTPIGRPIDRFDLRVVDEALNPVPPGWEGDLLLNGPGLARGYLGRPDLTAERFLPDPQAREPGARVYRTGDRVRWRPDGLLDYFGRRDQQLKIRGHRIEPAEIEAALSAQPGVLRAVVLGREVGEQIQLVAYVQAEAPWNEDAAGRDLQARLPASLLPSHWVVVSEWPLTRHGKLDAQALPLPALATSPADNESSRDSASPAAVAPDLAADSPEHRLLSVFRRVLGRPDAGLHDNFFSLGGDSITALQVAAAAQREGMPLAPDAVFNHQTVSALLVQLQRAKSQPEGLPERALIASHGSLRPTAIQQAFLQKPQDRQSHHAQAFVLELASEIKPAQVQAALDQWFLDHPALRLRADKTSSDWVLSIPEPCKPPMAARPLAVIDGTTWTASQWTAQREHWSSTLQAGTDLAAGQLLEAAMLMGTRRHELIVSCHHLAVDGVSWRILLEELESALVRGLQGLPPESRPEVCSLREWTENLPEALAHPRTLQQLPHWQSQMALARSGQGSRTAQTPQDGGPAGEEQLATRQLSAHETQAWLQEPAARWGLSPDVLLIGTLASVLKTAGGVVHLDVEGQGRLGWSHGLDLSRTVGWFTAVHPLVWRQPERSDLPRSVAAAALAWRSVPHHGVAFGALKQFHPDPFVRASLDGPAAPVLFNYHGQVGSQGAAGSLICSFDEAPGPSRDAAFRRTHALEVMAAVVDGRLSLSITHHPQQHSVTEVQDLLESWCRALEQFEPCSHQPPPEPDVPQVSGVSLSEQDLHDLERTLLG